MFGRATIRLGIGPHSSFSFVFSERSLYAIAHPSVVCLSETLAHPTQAVEILACGAMVVCDIGL